MDRGSQRWFPRAAALLVFQLSLPYPLLNTWGRCVQSVRSWRILIHCLFHSHHLLCNFNPQSLHFTMPGHPLPFPCYPMLTLLYLPHPCLTLTLHLISSFKLLTHCHIALQNTILHPLVSSCQDDSFLLQYLFLLFFSLVVHWLIVFPPVTSSSSSFPMLICL